MNDKPAATKTTAKPAKGHAPKKNAARAYLRNLDKITDKGAFTYAKADRDGLLTAMGYEACERVKAMPSVTDDTVQKDVDKYADTQGLTEYQAASIYGAALNTLCTAQYARLK